MTGCSVFFRRLAALSVAITVLMPPTARAQTAVSNRSAEVRVPTVLLNASAFARLVRQPRTDGEPHSAVTDPPRGGLYPQAIAAAAREAKSAPIRQSGTSDRSWVARHKVLMAGLIIGAGAFFGVWWYAECVSSGESCAP